jgi:hypothetical protein
MVSHGTKCEKAHQLSEPGAVPCRSRPQTGGSAILQRLVLVSCSPRLSAPGAVLADEVSRIFVC